MGENIWFLLGPICLMSQLAGSKYAPKSLRREGIPLLICLFVLGVNGAWSWWIPVIFVCMDGSYRLPFTLIGDSILDHWFNWIWIFVWSLILCGSGFAVLFIFRDYSWIEFVKISAVYSVYAFLFAAGSNIKFLANSKPWKAVEGFVYMFAVMSILAVLQ